MFRLSIVFSLFSFIGSQLQPTDLTHISEDLLSDRARMCFNVEECDNLGKIDICASDGKTYNSRCAFRKAACRVGSFVTFKHIGECTASEKCIGQRDTAKKQAKGTKHVYIPRCSPDGTFASVQCHEGTGYCWCSTPSGSPIPGSPKRRTLPDCKKEIEMTTPRPAMNRADRFDSTKGRVTDMPTPDLLEPCSHSDKYPCPSNHHEIPYHKEEFSHVPGTNLSTPVEPRRKSRCSGSRRKRFNKKMLKNMKQDLKRKNSVMNDFSGNTIEVLKWKFYALDTDENLQLTKQEYKGLQNLVRKNFKQKKCARKFPGICDINDDGKISLSEWVSCFSLKKLKNKSSSGKGRRKRPVAKLGIGEIYRHEPCKHDREQAIEASKNNGNEMYIPECDSEGNFLPLQCYGTKGKKRWYCFCVDSRTGTMLENSSVKNGAPKCFARKIWPKCKEPADENKFLTKLARYFVNFAPRVVRAIPNLTETSPEKLAAKKIFYHFDKNNSDYIEKKERKQLRKFVRRQRALRKCGGQIHIVCDSNNDKKISLQEFYVCLRVNVVRTRKNSVVPVGGNDVNPFEHYIKSE